MPTKLKTYNIQAYLRTSHVCENSVIAKLLHYLQKSTSTYMHALCPTSHKRIVDGGDRTFPESDLISDGWM